MIDDATSGSPGVKAPGSYFAAKPCPRPRRYSFRNSSGSLAKLTANRRACWSADACPRQILPPQLGGCPKRRERDLIGLVLLRCTVCAVSIDVKLSSAPVSPLVPRRQPPRHYIWPVASLGFIVIVNMAWIGFLGFEFVKLMKLAFS